MTGPQLDIHAIAHATRRKVTRDRLGRPTILIAGPGHSRDDESLSITLDPQAPDGFLANSFANDDPLQCRDLARVLAGSTAWSPVSSRQSRAQVPKVIAPTEPDEEAQRKAAWVRGRVREIWHEAHDPRGTIVQKYLHGRFLDLSDDIAVSVIRFHPKCPWREDENAPLIYVPAMVCAMRDIATDEIKAVHRRRLTPDGQKVGKPKMYGPARGAVVKVDPDEAVNLGLVLSEGVETALSARQFGYAPGWAAGSAGGIKNFPVLGGVEGLTLAAEEDNSGANALAIEASRDRWHAAGRDVLVLASRIGGDLNNALMGVRP